MNAWPEADAARYRAEGYWRGETFPRFLARVTAAYGDRTALVDDRVRLTYAELRAQVDVVSRGLRELGIGAGDAVLVQLPNRAEFVVLWFALQEIGAVPVHAQPGHRRTEITHLARMTRAVAHVIPDVHARFDYRDLAAACSAVRHVIVVGAPGTSGFIAWDDLMSARARPVGVSARPDDLALLLLSGGTTGLPKLVPRTHDDYLYNARAAAEVCRLDTDTVYLATLPVAFNFTMNCPGVLGTLGVGGTVVLADTQDPASCFDWIERERVTITAITPLLAPVWADEARHREADLSSLRVLQIGGARLAEDLAREVIDSFDCTVQQVFGMAEGLLCLTRLDDPPDVIATTQGTPVSPADELRVVDEHDVDVPDGEVGELLVKGPYTLRGYYRAPEHNATAFVDGYYRTGDLVRRLPSGHIVVVGRRKDQIQRAGEKFAAPEVEGHLQAHPAIRSVALVPAPDPVLGERSVAFIVPAGSTVPTRRDLAAYLSDRGLAAYKTVDDVRPLSDLPRTPVGKLDKKALARLLDDEPTAP
ncbi:(2,3-dihydroxybenzoyl)adenylate synthase [Actinokineospora fastidiosa]|uniref:2,3-dihydroxybenzoate-AMP ligase n=1 Tax=Actinokineospora fastidiosa TaxID=1816 RepID=A0A918LBL2_9PSEU|nr:AMP-binding protein [Actinokineospora fastidiosa]GGS29373.1 2,3-dihydroxybenzoate-AMP ligase [Actinokineospora fastidiosa]